jgi:hypothetical protein
MKKVTYDEKQAALKAAGWRRQDFAGAGERWFEPETKSTLGVNLSTAWTKHTTVPPIKKLPRFEVTIVETVAPGSVMETKVVVEAETMAQAQEAAKPPWEAPFGRAYVVKPLD